MTLLPGCGVSPLTPFPSRAACGGAKKSGMAYDRCLIFIGLWCIYVMLPVTCVFIRRKHKFDKFVKGRQMQKKRYALVGTGSRSRMFIDALIGPYHEIAELVALCDLSQVRMDWHNQRIQENSDAAPLPTYLAAQFDQMIEETRPDTVIVTTMDSTHH